MDIHISELELLTIGTVNDMYTEMNNDENQEAYSTLDLRRICILYEKGACFRKGLI